ncbi:LysM peptidoglycan-binding domain-containing protein [Halothermothrix orenii]|uniref:Peptidoglycan-binding LysM n=1 Tax=Halothermothrix orenii (strain H 168 / OCM 544 / DSM 9562) TaxID=373903 RepID=B8CXX0_HALOH|nr:LysM peptidoglycan-binding domain-containing protein [Halothermothrix orenii]ACL70139.1 Peptidoglycan-binding LysM [Halothermothrix orenii H 168]
MPTALQLANRILRQERNLQPLYAQLENNLFDPRYLRAVQTLRSLQARQINILTTLVDELEEEQPPAPRDKYYAQHILQMGENLMILAREYNTTVSEIRRVNPGLPAQPQPGQIINLPIEIPEPPEDSFRYIVRRGDTLSAIARRFNTDVDTLVRLNNIGDPDVIFPGRILIIPRS